MQVLIYHGVWEGWNIILKAAQCVQKPGLMKGHLVLEGSAMLSYQVYIQTNGCLQSSQIQCACSSSMMMRLDANRKSLSLLYTLVPR